jgi:hypothetical protein
MILCPAALRAARQRDSRAISHNDETSKPPQLARLPVAMSPDGAPQLMEQLRQRLEAPEVRRR